MRPEKLYVVLQKDLTAGLKMAQAVHAAFAFALAWPTLTREWHDSSNNIVVLDEDDLPSLAAELELAGFNLVRFTEPDLDDQLTAICVEPAAKKVLRALDLAA